MVNVCQVEGGKTADSSEVCSRDARHERDEGIVVYGDGRLKFARWGCGC